MIMMMIDCRFFFFFLLKYLFLSFFSSADIFNILIITHQITKSRLAGTERARQKGNPVIPLFTVNSYCSS